MACRKLGVYCRRKFPFNKRQTRVIIGLFICLFSSAFSITMLFPFLPFMVEFLLPSIQATSVGTYAGFIASSMFLGRFFGSYLWGLLGDNWGKKRVMIASEFFLGLASLAFGFSVNIYMACIFRFLVGLSNGIIGTAKAMLCEVTTNKTQPLGLALMASSFGIGIIIGPAVSGAIADPINQYNLTINNAVVNDWLTRFPYSLPGIVNFILCLISILAAIFLVPNTISDSFVRDKDVSSDYHSSSVPSVEGEQEKKEEEEEEGEGRGAPDTLSVDSGLEEQQRELITHEDTMTNENQQEEEDKEREGETGKVEYKGRGKIKRQPSFILSMIAGRRNTATLQYIKIPAHLTNQRLTRAQDEEQQLKEEEEEEVIEMDVIGGEGKREDKEKLIGKARRNRSTTEWIKSKLLLLKRGITTALKDLKMFAKDKATRVSVIIYCVFSFVIIGFDELYSIWCSTASYSGGIGFNLHEIGISLSIVGIVLLPFTFTFFPLVEKRLGSIKSFQVMIIIEFFFIILFPSIHFLVLLKSRVYVWLVLVLVLLVIRLGTIVGFSATSLFINNSVSPDKLGAINGLAVSLTSLFRCVSPLFVGSIYSASLSKTAQAIGFPLDYHLIFIVLGFILLLVVLMTTCLPGSVNRQKVRETKL